MSISFAGEFRKLKETLKCGKHVDKYCYVRPTDGEHEEQDVYKLTSWAKSIASNSFLMTTTKADFFPFCAVPWQCNIRPSP